MLAIYGVIRIPSPDKEILMVKVRIDKEGFVHHLWCKDMDFRNG